MKRASNILLKIAHIFGLVMGIMLLVSSIAWIVVCFMSQLRDAVIQQLEAQGVDFGELTAEQVVLIAQIMLACCAGLFVYLGIICIVDAVVSKKVMNNPSKGGYIACIILGVLSTDFSFVGGMLGIFALAKENRRKAREIENE